VSEGKTIIEKTNKQRMNGECDENVSMHIKKKKSTMLDCIVRRKRKDRDREHYNKQVIQKIEHSKKKKFENDNQVDTF
jgi:hypothetical protein